MAEERLNFKEMCARFDVTPRTLRYYEYIELLSPEKEGRSRFYSTREIVRMTLILRGRRWGFSLEEIRQWLLIYEEQGTSAQMQAWVELADRKLGAWVAAEPSAYQYLVESIRRFPDQQAFADLLREAGFKDVSYRNVSLGIACIHRARR